jgi:hypothetical protein
MAHGAWHMVAHGNFCVVFMRPLHLLLRYSTTPSPPAVDREPRNKFLQPLGSTSCVCHCRHISYYIRRGLKMGSVPTTAIPTLACHQISPPMKCHLVPRAFVVYYILLLLRYLHCGLAFSSSSGCDARVCFQLWAMRLT